MKRALSLCLSIIMSAGLFLNAPLKTNAATGIEAALEWAVSIAKNDEHGYSQDRRDGNPDYDCSSLVYYALKEAGIPIINQNGNASTTAFRTANMHEWLPYSGFEYLSLDQIGGSGVQRGDILFKKGHTEFYLGNNQTVGAHGDEPEDNAPYRSTAPGDQGDEISVAKYHSDYWEGVYRYSNCVNEGDDFYAALLKCDTWSVVGTNNGNVEIVKSTGKGNCIWHFVRSSDGSYVLYSCEDNRVLDCYEEYEGASVGVWDFYDSRTQHWWICGKQNGEYYLVRNGTELVLDVTGGSGDIGTNVELYNYHGSGAQLFSIYKVDKAEAGTLSVQPGDSATETKFTWDKGTNCSLYNLRIQKGTPGDTTPFLDKWNRTDTSYSEILPEGYYEAYVDFCNDFSVSMGKKISFTVSKAAEPQQTTTVPEVTSIKYGDANDDGSVDLKDVTFMRRKLASWDVTINETAADVNKDGSFDLKDVVTLRRYLAGGWGIEL